MTLTAGDELHVHQTPEPIAASGTDRNFYDRSFFCGWSPDGSVYFGVAFGIYPNLNVADAHLTIVRDGVEHCLHASKVLHSERTLLEVGPVSIEILKPLWALRVRVAETDGIGADVTFAGRHFPIEEPRFIHRVGTRAFMDYTRLTQAARVTGSVTVDGEELELAPDTVGLRDRSWGVRNVGLPDPQPVVPAVAPQFFWVWSPVLLGDRSTYFHVNADARGIPWNTRAMLCADGSDADEHEHTNGRMDLELEPGTRWVARGTLELATGLTLSFEPLAHHEMQGLGYFHPRWGHGVLQGDDLVVERETLDLASADPVHPNRWHRQLVCRVTTSEGEQGTGILEHLLLGPYAPLGLV